MKYYKLYIVILGSKGLNPHELAQMWVNVLETRQNMSIKVGHKHHDMRIFCRIVGAQSAEQSVGIMMRDY